jgi:MFS family permease
LTKTWPSARTGWYATFVLTLAFTFSFVDRQVLNLLVEPIKADLDLSDTRISFLQGFAFALPYIIMSVPLGRLVDKVNRIGVAIGGVVVWTMATFSSGISQNYMQLMASRMFVGAGESALSPAAFSMLADYFPPDKLARATSIYLMGPYLGGGLAMIGGAYVIEWFDTANIGALPIVGALSAWQFTFIAVALPGILIVWLLTTISNPIRRHAATAVDAAPPPNDWGDVWRFLKSHARIYIAVLLGVPFLVVVLYGLQGWVPTMLVRTFGWDLPTAGRIYGTIALLTGSAGVVSGPLLGQWLLRRGHADYPLRIGVAGSVGIIISMAALPFQTDATMALVCVGFASFFVTLPLALMTYVLQTVTPANMRGVLSGLNVVTNNILGLALGPTLVALTTDYIVQDPSQLNLSLSIVSVAVAPMALVLLASGMKPLANWHHQHMSNNVVLD